MEEARRTFIPAAGRDWALPFYDPMVRMIGGDRARRALLEAAALGAGQVVLDVGCGTGSLAVEIERMRAGVEVIGIDPDPRALARARRKADLARVPVRFDHGFADALPYRDGAFDRVLSSFVYHHLSRDDKHAMLREARRVLKPGGLFCLFDVSGPHDSPGLLGRRLHASSLLRDNDAETVIAFMRQAGFEGARLAGRGTMLLGLVSWSCFWAVAPEGGGRRG